MPPLVLIADPDAVFVTKLTAIAEQSGLSVAAHSTLPDARTTLHSSHPSAIVANVRLGEYNGIHLAYLARHVESVRRSIIYSPHHDPLLASDVQRAGGFYERQVLLPYSLRRLLTAHLPETDRRNVKTLDRRTVYRGGRRTTDLILLQRKITVLP